MRRRAQALLTGATMIARSAKLAKKPELLSKEVSSSSYRESIRGQLFDRPTRSETPLVRTFVKVFCPPTKFPAKI